MGDSDVRRPALVMDTYFGERYFIVTHIWLDGKCSHEKGKKSQWVLWDPLETDQGIVSPGVL